MIFHKSSISIYIIINLQSRDIRRTAKLMNLLMRLIYFYLFFFSSRRRHTRSLCDWSSDVCSSDLFSTPQYEAENRLSNFDPSNNSLIHAKDGSIYDRALVHPDRNNFAPRLGAAYSRSEERRVGKECRSRWSAYHSKKNRLDLIVRD